MKSLPEITLSLKDTEWPFEYTDHDRQIARAMVIDDDLNFYFAGAHRDDIFGKGRAVYRFKNLETDDSKIEMGDHTFKNFFIFSKYRKVAEKAIRDYMEYFATNKANTPATEDIDRLVKWYQTDSNTRIRYMTWQEEIDDMRALADEEKARADKAEKRADEEKARADRYEKMLKGLEKLQL